MVFMLFGILFLFMLLGFPMFLSIGFSTLAHYWDTGNARILLVFVQRTLSAVTGFSFLAVPMFMLAGNIMGKAGITERLLAFANALVGHSRGGLAQVNILGSILFAGISGSALADTAAIGSVLIPAMEKEGYEKGFAGAVTAASAIVGPVIPPSIVMVIYGAAFNVSIASLFAASFIPGLAIGLSQMVITYIISVRRGYPTHKRASLKEIGLRFREAIIPLLMPAIIIGGIFSGIFTATEASVMAVVYALIIGFLVYRTIKIADLYPLFINAALTSAGILIIIAVAQNFAWIIARRQIPQGILVIMLGLTDNKIVLLLLINLVLIVAGMFIDRNVNLFLLGPILIPVMTTHLGLSPIHTAMIIIFGLGLGHLTPPVGGTLYSTAFVGKMDVEEILKFLGPYILGLFGISMLVTFWPGLVEFLPRLLGFIK